MIPQKSQLKRKKTWKLFFCWKFEIFIELDRKNSNAFIKNVHNSRIGVKS